MRKARVKRVQINPEALFDMFQPGTSWTVEKGIPKTARLRGFTLDPLTQMLHLFVEDVSFEEIPIESKVAPTLETLFKKI